MICNNYTTPGGVSFIACSSGTRKRCKCGEPADILCDEPLRGGKRGKTCSAPCCRSCATNIGKDKDLCPPHAREREKQLAADAWLADLVAADGFTETVLDADTMERMLREAFASPPPTEGDIARDVARARQAHATPIGEKVRHVRNASQTRDHGCHWPGCPEQVPPAQWGCRRHWYMLPKTLRDKIWNAYRPGQERTLTPSREYVVAAREVQEWIERQERPRLTLNDPREATIVHIVTDGEIVRLKVCGAHALALRVLWDATISPLAKPVDAS